MKRFAALVAAFVVGVFMLAPTAQASEWKTGPRPDRQVQAKQYARLAQITGHTAAEVEAASTGDNGCRLSANWWVAVSAQWTGTTFSYGVLNSPGALLVGGSPDGTRSMFVLFRDGDQTKAGVYSRDNSKPGYVYRTIGEGGPDSIVNTTDIYQFPQAPSHIWCATHRFR